MDERATPREADEGFTLLEVVVSMLIFALMSAAVVGLVIKTISTSGNATQRAVAANLAERQKEYLLGVDYPSVVTGTNTQTVDGQTYTVATTVTQVARSQTGDRCDTADGANLAYKSIDVIVTWPAMGSTDPVRNETLRQIPQVQAGSTLGALSVSLKDQNAAGVKGLPVTLLNSAGAVARTAATDTYGCVVFSDLAVGNYSAQVNVTGYVGKDNVQAQSLASKAAVAGTQGKFGTILYAPAGSLKFLTSVPAGATVPANLGAGVKSTSHSTVAAAPGAVIAGSLSGLFPTAQKVWAGLCYDSASVVSNSSVPDAVNPPTLPLALYAVPVQVQAQVAGGSPKTLTVSAVHTTGDGCTTGETLQLSNAMNDQVRNLTVALPPGTWQLQVSDGSTTKLVDSPFTVSASTPVQKVSAP
ncbi:prepilin-type N-terminal cleavage/methylation domain-containing protein [Kineococcus sp. R86509]|uniref:prepilin-type N-terminal cleavage/methylation domain-containing protein n=1 Tax=Kineococcus sp. R86509 TaxID=3093851 RepID=UPI0036D41B72